MQLIICPLAIAYSMGQIIKLRSHFCVDFYQICTDVKPTKVKTSSLEANIAPHLPPQKKTFEAKRSSE